MCVRYFIYNVPFAIIVSIESGRFETICAIKLLTILSNIDTLSATLLMRMQAIPLST